VVDQFGIASANSPAIAGTVDFTSGSITETVKAAIFIFGHSTTDASITDHGALGIAMWADDGFTGSPGSENFSGHFYRVLNGVAATDARGFKDDAGISTTELDSSPAIDVVAHTCVAISGGVRLTFSTTVQVKITAIMFAGVSRSWVSTPGLTTSSAHENTGSAGNQFQPDLLIVAGSPPAGFTQSPDDFRAHLGFVVGSTHAGASIDIDRGTNPTDSDGRVDGVEIPFMISASGGTYAGGTFTIDSTGYNAQVTTGSAVVTSTVLALKFTGSLPKTTDNLSVTSAASQSFAVGFQPQIVIGMSTLMTTENSTTDGPTASTAGYFAFTSSAARAYTGSRLEGTGTTAKSYQGDFAVATLLHTGTVAQQATLAAMTATGFDLSFSTATAGFLTILAIGSGTVTSVQSETERISDASVVNLISRRIIPETEQISDNVGGLILADGLSALGPIGYVFQGGAEEARVQQGGIDAATVDE